MWTQKVKLDPGALEGNRAPKVRRSAGKGVGAFAVMVAIGLMAVACSPGTRDGQSATAPADQPPSSTTAPGTAAPAGTVTFDGSTCSMEITADRIESGLVVFNVVNATEKPALFDSYQLLEGYAVRSFAAVIERDRRRAEPWIFPDQETEVRYLRSDVIAANSSEIIVTTMSPGRHAIVCMHPYEGEVMDFRPFGVVGPIPVR
ncbi:MAG: hypothetical protein WEA10_05925 [Actinomycetota bacterium]